MPSSRVRVNVDRVGLDAAEYRVGDRIADLLGEVPEQPGAAGQQHHAAEQRQRDADVGQRRAARTGAVEGQSLAEDPRRASTDRLEQRQVRAELALAPGELEEDGPARGAALVQAAPE